MRFTKKHWAFAGFVLVLAWCGRDGTRMVHASGILSIPPTVVQTNQSNAYSTGTQNFSAAVHTAPTIVVATVGVLPASGCVNGELAIVTGATPGQQIYENSTAGSCTWTQQLNTGSSSGGGVITYSGAGVSLTGTLFFPAGGGGVPSGTESNVDLAASSAGTITNLSVQMSVAPGMGNSVAITWRKAGSDQSSTCTISGASSTECQDTTHSFNVSQGDLIDYKVVTTGIIAGTPGLSIMSQYGSTLSSGSVNSGTTGQCAYYAANGTAVSAFTPSGDLGGTCPTPTVVNLSNVTNASLPNSGLVNASVTVNGSTCTLGSSCSPAGGASTAQGTYAALPANCSTGNLYFETDSIYTNRCSATNTWSYFLPRFGLVVPPGTVSTSWVNQGSATLTQTNGIDYISQAAGNSSSHNLSLRYVAIPTPASPYTITAKTRQLNSARATSGNNRAGIALRDSVSGKIITLDIAWANSAAGSITVNEWTNPTTFSSGALATVTWVGQTAIGPTGWPFQITFRIVTDSTNTTYFASDDGVLFFQIFQHAKNTFVTPTGVAYFIENFTQPVDMFVDGFTLTQP